MRSALALHRIARLSTIAVASVASAQPNCAAVSVGLTPIDDLGQGLYLGQFRGGLYPDGMNQPPPAHLNPGRSAAAVGRRAADMVAAWDGTLTA